MNLNSRESQFFFLIALVFAYVAFGQIGLWLMAENQLVTPVIFIPEGLALAAALLLGARVWPAILLGQLLLGLSRELAFEPALLIAIGNSLEAVLAVFLLRRLGLHLSLDRLRDLALLVAVVVLVLQPFSASLSISVLWGYGLLIGQESLLGAWLSWWMANLMGQIQITPLLLGLFLAPARLRLGLQRSLLPLLLMLPAIWLIFAELHPAGLPLALVLLFPLLLWIAERGGLVTVSLASSLLSLACIYLSSPGSGPFVRAGEVDLLGLNLFLLGLVLTGQWFAVLSQQRRDMGNSNLLLQQRLDGLFRLSPLGIVLTDLEGRFVEFNQAFCRITGYSREELLELGEWQLTPNRYSPWREVQLRNLRSKGRFGPLEKEYQRKDGSLLAVQWNGLLLREAQDEEYIWAIVEDISVRKASEHELEQSRDRYRRLVNDLGPQFAIYSHDMNGVIEFLGKGAEQILRRPLEECIGKHFSELAEWDPGMVEAAQLRINYLAETGQSPAPFEVSFRRADGSRGLIRVTAHGFRDASGACVNIEGIAEDISQHQALEEQLLQGQSLLKHAQEGIIITDADGQIIDVNQAFSRITGYPREEVLGRRPDLLKSGQHPVEFYRQMWQALLREGSWSGEICNRNRAGELFWERLTIVRIKDAEGHPRQYLGLFSPINPSPENSAAGS
ncbi:MAG: PAS domain S-box protein [Gammaproteobacteria bacterium]|nr:PAS domain S-box protein [Gammaproteobacteria bacterium]